ncbi:hypothetical protein D3C85_1236510 [compost metagenome]
MRLSSHLREFAELPVITHGKDEIAVSCRKVLIRHDVRMSIAQAFRRITRSQVIHRLVSQASHLHIQQRHINMLPATVMIPVRKRSENCYRRIEPRQDVSQRNADFDRPGTLLAFRSPRQTHETTKPLNHEVVASAFGIGPRLTKAGDRAIDQIRINRPQRFVVQPIRSQTTYLEVLDQNVRLGGQFTHQPLPLRTREVDSHRLLVAIGRQVIGSLTGVLTIGIL